MKVQPKCVAVMLILAASSVGAQDAPPPGAFGDMGAVEAGVNYQGGDLYSNPSSTAQDCFSICAHDGKCLAATFVASLHTCWLKDRLLHYSFDPKSDVSSSVKQRIYPAPQPPGGTTMSPMHNANFPSHDMYSTITPYAAECSYQCLVDRNCRSATYVKSRHECWLKDTNPTLQLDGKNDMFSTEKLGK